MKIGENMKFRAVLTTIALGVSIGMGSVATANPTVPVNTSAVISTELGGVSIPAAAAPAVKAGNTLKASCVIRFDHADGKTPIMLGGSHACVGVKSAVINQHGDLELRLTVTDPFKWKINSLFIQVDEQLGGVVTVGGSGGTDRLRIRFHTLGGKRLILTKPEDRAVIWGLQKNIWYSAEWLDANTFVNGGQ